MSFSNIGPFYSLPPELKVKIIEYMIYGRDYVNASLAFNLRPIPSKVWSNSLQEYYNWGPSPFLLFRVKETKLCRWMLILNVERCEDLLNRIKWKVRYDFTAHMPETESCYYRGKMGYFAYQPLSETSYRYSSFSIDAEEWTDEYTQQLGKPQFTHLPLPIPWTN